MWRLGSSSSQAAARARREPVADDDTAGFLFAWERIVLAGRISSTTKLVAFAMRTFADPDGTGVRPGTARLAVLCGLSDRCVVRARRELLGAGLLKLVRRGNRRRGHADEYRLILAEDLDERLTWLSPSEITDAAQEITEARQAAETSRLRRRASSDRVSPDEVQETQTTPERPIRRHRRPGSGDTDDPPPTQGDHPSGETNSGVGNVTHHPHARAYEEPIPIAEGGNDRPACPVCGALLDPDGSCFVCRHATRSAS